MAGLRGSCQGQGHGGSEVRLGLRPLPGDGYHLHSAMAFQFHGCLVHHHDCCRFDDGWLSNSTQVRCEYMEHDTEYLRNSCHYTLVIIWECECEYLKCNDHVTSEDNGYWDVLNIPQPLTGSCLPMPGSDLQLVLQSIHEEHVFGLGRVDIHMPEALKNMFINLPSIFPSSKWPQCPGMTMPCIWPSTANLLTMWPHRDLPSSIATSPTLIHTLLLQL